jgi:anti-anti-sigma factor
MNEGRARTEVRFDEGVPVVALVGEFDLACKDQLHQQFRALQDAKGRRVVVDLSQTRFLDSTTLGVLVRAHFDGLQITIRGASGIVRRALEVTGLAAVFDAAESPLRADDLSPDNA